MSSHIPYRPHSLPSSTLGSLETLPQNIRVRILTLALQGGAEIHVSDSDSDSEDLRYIVPQHALPLLQVSRALRDEVLQNVITFVFRRPAALSLFLTAGGEELAVPSLLSPRQMSSVRLVILDALETDIHLTDAETRGVEGPNITPFFQEWSDATRHLPTSITVGVVELDLYHSFPLRFHVVGRLVQRISTTVHLRSGRYTMFRISGCRSVGTQRFIEDSTCALVGGASRKHGSSRQRGRSGGREWGPDDDYFDLFEGPKLPPGAEISDESP